MFEHSVLVRLSQMFPGPPEGDRELLEHMWGKFDQALAGCRLEIHDEKVPFGDVRVVTALGLIRVKVDVGACDAWAYAIEEDGSVRRIGRGLPATRLFHWWSWMRFAFQRWAPQCSAIDFIEDPLNRPSNVELATCRMLIGRLAVDRRFWSLSDEFDAATGIPPFAAALVEDVRHWRSMEDTCEAWRLIEQTNIAIQRASMPARK